MGERLQKLMAQAGLGSRRHNETLIEAGRVRVNGRVAQLGDRADLNEDRVLVDGKPLKAQPNVYIMLHKPRGVLSSTEDELDEGRRTVRDMVDYRGHLYPVGRLDKPSEGLILLTNDGSLAHRLTHPRFGHEKTYRVWIIGTPTDAVLQQWREGVLLDDRETAPARVNILERLEGETVLEVVLREGRKRQIRRVAAQLGHPVVRLKRLQLGPLRLDDLPRGRWRHLAPSEVKQLKLFAQGGRRGGKRNRSQDGRRRRKGGA